MEQRVEVVVALIAGFVTFVWWILSWWNFVLYVVPVKRRCAANGTKLPPGYMGLPFLGEMLTFLWYFKFLRRPDEFINSKSRNDEVGLYTSHLFGKPCVIACSPQAMKLVLKSEEMFFQEWPSVELMGANSLIAISGKPHDRIKGFLMRAINTPHSLRQIALLIQPLMISSLHLWAEKGRITVYDEVKKVSLQNIGKYFAGFEPGFILDSLGELFKGMVAGIRAYPINVPGTALHHALKCRKKLKNIFAEEMERRKKTDKQSAKNDVLEGLMQMKDEEGNQLSDIEVLDNIVGLVVGGYESTVLAIMWAFYYLAKYPNVVNKLREEHINLATQKQTGDFITYDEILTCKYTSKVVEETIRLANIAAFVFRTASEDVEYKGYTIPKGWKVICMLRYVHTDPKNFDDPMCFNPDRWNEPPKPGTNLVFGRGPRLCPGNMLARLQLSMMLHYLVMGYRWELVNGDAKMIYLPHPKPEDGIEIDIWKI